ncbi:MAG TPA: ABC transporter permease subunit [Kiloniellales bacterium]|nr:ABC transporter permease subunit [Kiloniellales bacterium]
MSDLDLFAWGTGWGDELAYGLLVTFEAAIAGYGLGLLIGLATAYAELSRSKALRWLAKGYGLVFRSVPELLIIFLFYYGGAFVLRALLSPFGVGRIDLSAFAAGVAALAVIQSAYASQIFRGAILAVPRAMVEAALSLGLHRWQVQLKVTLPLALRYAFGGLVNLWVNAIKTTPLLAAIGLEDFVRAADKAGQNTKAYFAFFAVILVVYLALSAATLWLQRRYGERLFRHLGPLAGERR